MPDWFYRTVSRPLLFRLPSSASRSVALKFMGGLSRLPGGRSVIDFLGHMRAPAPLHCELWGRTFPTPLGLGPGLDVDAEALLALSRFGFGFVEVGPVTMEPVVSSNPVERRTGQQALRFPDPPPNIGLDAMARRLSLSSPMPLFLMIRIGHPPGTTSQDATAEGLKIIERLSVYADAFSTPATLANAWSAVAWQDYVRALVVACKGSPRSPRLLICLSSDGDTTQTDRVMEAALDVGVEGVVVDGAVRDESGEGRVIGLPAQAPSLALTRHLRQRWGGRISIIGAGGIHEPADALAQLEAGADLVQADSGLVYSGPGLPKQINEALMFQAHRRAGKVVSTPQRVFEMSWFWTLLLGIGMLMGSVIAMAISATRVVLEYDETFVGMTRQQLDQVNPRLLPFLAHDRVTLAGVMMTIGVLYVGLSLGGVRRGLHWAQQTVVFSALAGFLSFFLFLGFGYFDPFHAFVTAILFQFLLLALHSRLGAWSPASPPLLREDWRWRWNQWGQLLFVIHGVGLLAAGVVISVLGITQVFVPEDLQFMQTSSESLHAVSHKLVPLIAHDRATLGGMLISSGIAILLPALWGFQQGHRWLWWTLLCAGLPAYLSAVGVHLMVGYLNLWHLAPAFAAFVMYAAGLFLSYPYLCKQAPKLGQ